MAVAMGEARRRIFLLARIFAQVGPHFEGQRIRRNASRISTPVNPAFLGGISGAAEPALVAAKHLPMKRCCANLGSGRTPVRLQPLLFLTARLLQAKQARQHDPNVYADAYQSVVV